MSALHELAGETLQPELPIKAIIFDCFGVLLGNTYKQRLAALDRDEPEKAQELRAINRASDMGILTRQESAQYIADLLGEYVEDVLEEQDRGEVRNEALIRFIETLKPHYKLGLLSNISDRGRLGIRFLPGQLDGLFDTVVASGDAGYVKPQPEIYEITATRLGVSPLECVMIDDILEFCDGAQAVGMRAIQFIDTKQCVSDLGKLIDRGN